MKQSEKGFTLLEAIISLILIGLMALFIGFGIQHVIRGYLFARDNDVVIQKGQIAMSRITQELKNISLISSPSTSTSITFYSFKNDIKSKRSIRLSNDGKKVEVTESYSEETAIYSPLTDQVALNGFSLEYYTNYGDTS